MNESMLRKMLHDLQTGAKNIDEVVDQLRQLPFVEIDFARVDLHRSLRQGLAEVVWAEGKTVDQIDQIAHQLAEHQNNVLITRLDAEKAQSLISRIAGLRYHRLSRTALWQVIPTAQIDANVVIVTAGTADLPVALEAEKTLEFIGICANVIADVGVAGIHRLLACIDTLMNAQVVIVVAGMDGALGSVVAGMVCCPVICVPTSVGYGAHWAGLTPLFAMLSSCAAGAVVVNIDNGFGAAMAAFRMIQSKHRIVDDASPS